MLDLKRLRSFIAVAEDLNFRRAASRIGLSQPPLSRHIKELEAELGVVLFLRTNRQVLLTPAGHALLARARPLLAHAAEVVQRVRNREQDGTRRASVGFVPSAACQILAPVLDEFRRRHPDIAVDLHEMTADEQLDALLSDRLDIGLMRLPVPHPRLATRVLLREPFVLALSEAHLLAEEAEIRPSCLDGLPLVLYPARAYGAGLHIPIESFLHEAGATPGSVLVVNSFVSAIGLAAAGAALAMVPRSMEQFRPPGVVYRRFAGSAPVTELGMTWRRATVSAERDAFIAVADWVAGSSSAKAAVP